MKMINFRWRLERTRKTQSMHFWTGWRARRWAECLTIFPGWFYVHMGGFCPNIKLVKVLKIIVIVIPVSWLTVQ